MVSLIQQYERRGVGVWSGQNEQGCDVAGSRGLTWLKGVVQAGDQEKPEGKRVWHGQKEKRV